MWLLFPFYYFINDFILNMKFTCPVTLDFADEVGFPDELPLDQEH